ncbi:hypothetical protein DPEC_G00034020 [Dallia pectoralis]|uniref:Uncharacterized protein n=1 Tax=Dallia pectoralis TaxID=75939 RepID=A0ACC2HCW6_DALPE|nr:hypothetical protein DPEC_G00034020 [Dallia pectoralis]
MTTALALIHPPIVRATLSLRHHYPSLQRLSLSPLSPLFFDTDLRLPLRSDRQNTEAGHPPPLRAMTNPDGSFPAPGPPSCSTLPALLMSSWSSKVRNPLPPAHYIRDSVSMQVGEAGGLYTGWRYGQVVGRKWSGKQVIGTQAIDPGTMRHPTQPRHHALGKPFIPRPFPVLSPEQRIYSFSTVVKGQV